MKTPMTLPGLFADAGEHFGLSRPAGHCLGMIWRAAQAPCADDLTRTLGLSRSNVSTALKELRGWGLVSVARAPGDRKEYFTAPSDPWELIRAVMAARQRRAIAPILDRLLAAEAESPDARIAALHAALETVSDWTTRLGSATPAEIARHFAQGEDAMPTVELAKKKKTKKKKRKAQ